jgi:hypothetical protein
MISFFSFRSGAIHEAAAVITSTEVCYIKQRVVASDSLKNRVLRRKNGVVTEDNLITYCF